MMLYPSIDALMDKVDSKYFLVVAAAKRARELQDGSDPLVKADSGKEVTTALNEIFQDKIHYSRM